MKRWVVAVMLLMVLTGCSAGQDAMDKVLSARTALQAAKGCRFDAVITADYGETLHTFRLACETDQNGTLYFAVTSPDTISGVTGTISREAGNLTFDDQILAISLLADGQLSPVSGPWIVVNTLRSGYISSCGWDGENLLASIDDSYADDALHVDVTLSSAGIPLFAEILWQGRRILSVELEYFEYL